MTTEKALKYAAFAFISAAATQLVQVGVAFAANQAEVLNSPTRWCLSAAVGVVMAGLLKAIPWIELVLSEAPEKPAV